MTNRVVLPVAGETFKSKKATFKVLESPLPGFFRCVATSVEGAVPFEVLRSWAQSAFLTGAWKAVS